VSKKSSVMESIVISLLGNATEFGGHLVDKLVVIAVDKKYEILAKID